MFSKSKCAKTHCFCMVHNFTALSHTHSVRPCLADLGQFAHLLRFTGQKGCSRRSSAVIVSRRSSAVIVSLLSVFARSEAVYDMHFVLLRAVFLHQEGP